MLAAATQVVRLSDLQHGQEAACFAALVRKETGTDKHGNPFVKCHFRDKRILRIAPIWFSNALIAQAPHWREGEPYRLFAKGNHNVKFGFQLELMDIRTITKEDADDGYDFFDLVETSERDPCENLRVVREYVGKLIEDPLLRQLVETVLEENEGLILKMPAAQNIHHSYTGGLIEHVWSMTRIAGFVADHYARYYAKLNPPLNKGVIIAACVLHDVGKVLELDYHPVEAKYTVQGKLVGHVLIGRDMARDAARKIDGFPPETLLLLEHAILAHHGKEEFGAPKAPQTLEALIVHYIDDMDSKVNAVAGHRLKATGDDPFTDRLFALNNRQFYKGLPLPGVEETFGDDHAG